MPDGPEFVGVVVGPDDYEVLNKETDTTKE